MSCQTARAEPCSDTSEAMVDQDVLPVRSPSMAGRSSSRARSAARSSSANLSPMRRSLEPPSRYGSTSASVRQLMSVVTSFPQVSAYFSMILVPTDTPMRAVVPAARADSPRFRLPVEPPG